MLKFAIEYACERSNACGGSFCAGSAPSTTCGWLAADTEYLLKAKKTPPVTGAANRWNVCTCVSFAVGSATLTPSSVMRMRKPLPLNVPGSSSSGCASRNARCAYGFARCATGDVGAIA